MALGKSTFLPSLLYVALATNRGHNSVIYYAYVFDLVLEIRSSVHQGKAEHTEVQTPPLPFIPSV
jgi:hypothetical protein